MSVMRKTDILLQWDNEKRSPLGPSVDRFRVPRFGQRRGYILYFLHLPSSDKDIHLPLISTWSWSELQLWFRWRRWYWTLIELLVPLWEVQYAKRTCISLSQLLLIGSYYLEQDLNILQIHLQSSTCAGYLKYEFWVLLLEMPGQLLFLTFNTGTDRTTLSPAWTLL